MSESLLNVLMDDVTELIREAGSTSEKLNDDQFLKSFKSKIKNRFKDQLASRLRRQSSPRESGLPPRPPKLSKLAQTKSAKMRSLKTRTSKKRKISSPILSQQERPRPRVASIVQAQKKRECDLKKDKQRNQRKQRQKERRVRMERKRKAKNRKSSKEKWTSPEPPRKIRRKGSKEILRKNSCDTFRKNLSQESKRRKRSNSSPREDPRHTPTEPFLIPKSRLKTKNSNRSIEISDYESEGEDSGMSGPSDWDQYPQWARPSNVLIQLNHQEHLNPELTFGRITDVVCNIKEIFSTPDADNSRVKRRTVSGDWTKDILGSAEIRSYDEEMGFKTLSQS